MSGWYLLNEPSMSARAVGGLLIDDGMPSDGDSTIQGKKIEPTKDIKENRTSANEPFRAMSPIVSVDVPSSAALFASWR